MAVNAECEVGDGVKRLNGGDSIRQKLLGITLPLGLFSGQLCEFGDMDGREMLQ